MCGIAGVITYPTSHVDVRTMVDSMTRALHRRGPDAQGIWLEENVALGHRRLSIVDLSEAGSQPMLSDCGRYVIVFNGEIYNHRELRRQLESGGLITNWRGHSDTETLLAAIVHWGLASALTRVTGMFALALWDRRERLLELARDRMGEKPLYWGWCGSDFVFASELKAVREHPDCPKTVCRDALAQYVRFSYVPAPRSIHPGLYKLEPGCILSVRKQPPAMPPTRPLRPGDAFSGLSIERYWSLDEATEQGRAEVFRTEEDALRDVEAALRDAVSSQMVADVPLGAFLSGGIDSSLIVSLMQALSPRPISTFTVGFENKAFNEAPFAADVARHLGTDHTEVLMTEQDALNVIPNLPEFYDEPFADASQIPTHLVSQVARRKVTVALSGDGGDELFGGYNRYFWAPRIWSSVSRIPPPARRMIAAAVRAVPISAWNAIGSTMPGAYAVNRAGDKAHKLASRLGGIGNLEDLYRSLVSEWTSSEIVSGGSGDPLSILDDPVPDVLHGDAVSLMMFQDLRTYLPDDILCKVDRAAMGVSLETRAPFLDRGVVETAARLPVDMKIRDGKGKWLIRQILYRHVPKELIERPKAGFGLPIGHWLRGPLRAWADGLLNVTNLSRDALMDPQPIRRAWAEHLSGQRDWSAKLWIILMYLAWRERWAIV